MAKWEPKRGELIRYRGGPAALALHGEPHAGGWHGVQCMGGHTFYSDVYEPTQEDRETWVQCAVRWRKVSDEQARREAGLPAVSTPAQEAQPVVDCPKCRGPGEVFVERGSGPDTYDSLEDCPNCAGTGGIDAAKRIAELEAQTKCPPAVLTWLFTHCRAIGMTCKSVSGKWEEDIALFTINQKQRIAELEAELDEARKDAERYQWLRHGDNDEAVMQRGPVDMTYHWLPRRERLDAAIDAALAKEPT